MDFLDSLFDKIPFMRDLDKKKRMLLAGFAVFALISILGILIDAIAGAGGIIAVVAVVIGFLLMAAIILIDFFMSGKNDQDTFNQNDGYKFFDELSDENMPYDNDNYGYQVDDVNNGYDDYENVPSDDMYDQAAYSGESYNNGFEPNYNGGNFRQDEQSFGDISYETPSQEIEYSVAPEQAQPVQEEPAPRRFGGMFRRGQANESTAISDEINSAAGNSFNVSHGNDEYQSTRSSFEFTNEPDIPSDEPMVVQAEEEDLSFKLSYRENQQSFAERQPLYGITPQPRPTPVMGKEIGKPVMTFQSHYSPVQDEVSRTADYVAPNISTPASSDVVGGPVMSIPTRSAYEAPRQTVTETPVQTQPVQQYAAPQPYAAPAYQNTYSAPSAAPQTPAYQQGTRGQEIEAFFDNMSDDELLYSDCVEVWASDAKPAAIRLLKQIESLPDKKKADALGREAEYVNAMIDRIYYFTMLDSIRDNLELKKYNFSVMVKECLRRFSPFFMEKRIGLLWKGLDIDIVTDKRWLIFALTQVVFNAVEFTGLGGKIAISAKKEGSLIHLMVDDSGCGISEEDLPHIFMAGFMGDNVPNESGRRTGMGLFITRSVVEKLGGTVTADSSPNKGTRITIILPEKQ